MNSNACDESPNKFLRCSAAASLGSVSAYVMICFNESSSSGSNFERRGVAQFKRFVVMFALFPR